MVVTPISSVDDIYQLLTNYATQYFDSIVKNGDTITCYDGEIEALRFTYVKYEADPAPQLTDVYIYGYEHPDAYNDIYYIVRTAYGLVFVSRREMYADDSRVAWIVVTKDNEDDTVIFSHPVNVNSYHNIRMEYFYCSNTHMHNHVQRNCLYTRECPFLMTSTVPVIVENDIRYCPNLKWIIQKQFDYTGDLVIGTSHYWTDGQIALLDT